MALSAKRWLRRYMPTYWSCAKSLWRSLHRAAGPDPESKRQMSTLLGVVGTTLLIVSTVTNGPASSYLLVFGIILVVFALAIANWAAGQQRTEARAQDLIEWKREEQALRREIGPLWEQLERAYSKFKEVANIDRSFEELLKESDWPDAQSDADNRLLVYLREIMPSDDYDRLMTPSQASSMRRYLGDPNEAGSGRDDLLDHFKRAKDFLEVWSVALRAGGSREAALREVVRGLRENHEDSIRLIWYISIAHTEWKDVVEEPDYSFVRRVRDVMVG